ncbi:MAG: hypothetical protein WDN49_18685 [Acetobacteraceae bacterium]
MAGLVGITIANINAPEQIVVGGAADAVGDGGGRPSWLRAST